MSNKNPQSGQGKGTGTAPPPAQQKIEDKARPASETAADEEVEPDEADRAELEEARKVDSTMTASRAESKPEATTPTSEGEGEGEEDGAEGEGEIEIEPEEIVALRSAFQRVQDKIDWHKSQIGEHQEEIKGHEGQIDELQSMLRSKFSGLVGSIGGNGGKTAKSSTGGNKTAKPSGNGGGSRKPTGPKTRTNYGDGNSTGDLIAACLKRSKKPVNTEQLVKYLEDNGNNTNPSVELSRMVKKGLVGRPERGFYEWQGE